MNAIRHCLLKGNDTFLDHRKSIREHGCCWWTQSHKLRVGDICYLYIADAQSRSIRYKMEVVDACCERKDKDCWNKPFKPDSCCAKLVPVSGYYSGNQLTMERLEEIGISRHTIFRHLTEEQSSVIDSCFKDL